MSNVDGTFLFADECSKLGKKIRKALKGHNPDAVFFSLAIAYLESYPSYVLQMQVGGLDVPGSPVDFLNHLKESINGATSD